MGFPEFWSAYPRKVGKLDAAKAYAAAIKKGYTHDELLLGIRGFNQLCLQRGTDRTFIPHPGTWLRAGRWQDEETKGITGSPEMMEWYENRRPSMDAALGSVFVDSTLGVSSLFRGCEFTKISVICPLPSPR